MNFVTFAFETGNYRHTIYSIGIVKYQDGKKVDTFYSLLKPPELCVQPNFDISHAHLTVEELKNAPTFAELWESRIYPFIRGYPILSHHFDGNDVDILIVNLEWYGLPRPILKYFCFPFFRYKVWPSLNGGLDISGDIPGLTKELGIVYNADNTLDNAEVYGKIALKAAEKLNSSSLDELLKATEEQIKLKAKSSLYLWEDKLDDSVRDYDLKELEAIDSELMLGKGPLTYTELQTLFEILDDEKNFIESRKY